ncbi:MAG: divalent metal cation transporter, partial [Cyclobacteriaceae bacterium]|nr:divalent metal cation transporter [Cyclobacteriaceae bacterium]
MIKLRQTFLNTVFWSVIAAAFIGPGTLATASSAGALFELDIMWALVFAIMACIILQEGSARITILTGNDFGKTIQKYAHTPFNRSIMYLISGGVLFGCAAYQAGNILGAISGLGMILSFNTKVLTVIVALSVFGVLWKGNISLITKILGICVGIMGISFFAVALQAEFEWDYFFRSLIIPSFPRGGGLLILGLVGTTIVPYNLFLGSSMGKGKSLKSMRMGIGIAVLIGGMISIAILISGTFIEEKVSF